MTTITRWHTPMDVGSRYSTSHTMAQLVISMKRYVSMFCSWEFQNGSANSRRYCRRMIDKWNLRPLNLSFFFQSAQNTTEPLIQEWPKDKAVLPRAKWVKASVLIRRSTDLGTIDSYNPWLKGCPHNLNCNLITILEVIGWPPLEVSHFFL